MLLYEDSYSFGLIGQFNVKYSDGVYSISRIEPDPQLYDEDEWTTPLLPFTSAPKYPSVKPSPYGNGWLE